MGIGSYILTRLYVLAIYGHRMAERWRPCFVLHSLGDPLFLQLRKGGAPRGYSDSHRPFS
ncbi:hypothetical protein MTBUT4_340030 [Magnetospirillum sp. UT-4]|nr:hypothetical protein MTBUT4_340030 [Magnetospirillum sp. UT-4]